MEFEMNAAPERNAIELSSTRPDQYWTSAQWVAYFRANADVDRPYPWERGAEVTAPELAAIGRSLQAWQLGETSDGWHLRAAAARHAGQTGDPDFLVAIELFIREEQRHGETLGRFLDLAGVGRVKADWGDKMFRATRYCLRSIEAWTTPVVMVETMALVYYNAVRRATGSPLLRSICGRILADEIPHLRFQCERLAMIFQGRSRPAFRLTMLAHRSMFIAVVALIWLGYRRALRAGGYSWRRYWRASWDRMNVCWRTMDPRRERARAVRRITDSMSAVRCAAG